MKNNRYQIIFPPGASGNFLRNFLDIDFPNTKISNWAQDIHNKALDKVLYDSYIVCTHKKRFDAQHTIGIIPANNEQLIKIIINRYLKSNKIYLTSEFDISSNKFLDKIFISIVNELSSTNSDYIQNIYTSHDILDGQLNVYSADFDFCVYYDQIFDIDYLKKLYYKINGISVNNSKLEFANGYINYHKNFYQTTFYKVLYQILKFEYENQLLKKTKTWSVDSFDLNNIEACDANLRSFLRKENYH